MRDTLVRLRCAAASSATVLLEGETGSGKGAAALAIHEESARRDGPFLTIDCGAIPATLLESELFGHERGAFTGATGERQGVFEAATGGTVFLDEIGEMPLALQPKLLRVLEDREVRRVGANDARPIDVRVIAATNRSLRGEVEGERFRADLYFRLAVLRVALPPLSARGEDLPALVDAILRSLGASGERADAIRSPAFLATLQRRRWPGNVRELRNVVERRLAFGDAYDAADEIDPAPTVSTFAIDTTVSLAEARQHAVDALERQYLVELMRVHRGKMGHAARAAGIGRIHLYRLLKRHGMK